MTMTANKSTNYPQDVIDSMVSAYEANPTRTTVNELAAEFNKTERSVIAKLSALGVYVAQPKPTKRPPQGIHQPVCEKTIINSNDARAFSNSSDHCFCDV